MTDSENPHVYGGEPHWALIQDDEFGQIVADVETAPNAESLARLLAAAPELLDALETVNEWSIASHDDDFPYPCVEAALRKARGR